MFAWKRLFRNNPVWKGKAIPWIGKHPLWSNFLFKPPTDSTYDAAFACVPGVERTVIPQMFSSIQLWRDLEESCWELVQGRTRFVWLLCHYVGEEAKGMRCVWRVERRVFEPCYQKSDRMGKPRGNCSWHGWICKFTLRLPQYNRNSTHRIGQLNIRKKLPARVSLFLDELSRRRHW
jgi:hypothetical protein